MAVVDQAIHELEAELASAGDGMQEQSVLGFAVRDRLRDRLNAVMEALSGDRVGDGDGWLAARGRRTDKDRLMLVSRLSAASARMADHAMFAPTATEVRRLTRELDRYLQRVHDLAYDAVELELGGSE